MINQISNSEAALQAAWSSMPFAVREMFEWQTGSVLLLNERVVQWCMVQSIRASAVTVKDYRQAVPRG